MRNVSRDLRLQTALCASSSDQPQLRSCFTVNKSKDIQTETFLKELSVCRQQQACCSVNLEKVLGSTHTLLSLPSSALTVKEQGCTTCTGQGG